MSPSSAAGTGDVRRSVDNTLKCHQPRLDTTAVKPVIATDQDTTSTDRKKKSWLVRADEWLQKDVQSCWCIRGYQARGTWLLQLLVLSRFSFVGVVDIYTVLWASAGFVYRAAWASMSVSIIVSGVNMLGSILYRKEYEVGIVLYLFVGAVWAPIEITLKASNVFQIIRYH